MTVGSIIGGAFRLVRERPGAVALWGLIYLAATVALMLTIGPMFAKFAAIGGNGAQMAPEDLSQMMSAILLFELVFFVIMTVLFAASQRAVLQPERQGLAYLRLGMDELRLIGLALLLLIGFYVGFLVGSIIVALVAGVTAVAAGAGGAVPLMVAGMLALFGVAIWLQVRLSLAFPLTLLRGRIIIGEAWRASRGRFWTLFGAYFLISLLLLVLWIAATLVTTGSYFAELAASGFTPEGMQAAAEHQMARQFGEINATTVIGWVLGGIAGGLSIALLGGAMATAARELTAGVDELAETFA
jgi:hypothetical protein